MVTRRDYNAEAVEAARSVLPHLRSGLVREGLEKIARHFSSVANVGPTHVARFEEVFDEEEEERLRRDACERINYLLERLGRRSSEG